MDFSLKKIVMYASVLYTTEQSKSVVFRFYVGLLVSLFYCSV